MVTAKKFSLFELVTPSREARYAPTSLDSSGTLLQNPIRCALFLKGIKTLSRIGAAFFSKATFCALVPCFSIPATVLQLCHGQSRNGVISSQLKCWR